MIRKLTLADEDWLRQCYEGTNFWFFMHALVNNGSVWGDGYGYASAIQLRDPIWYLGEHSPNLRIVTETVTAIDSPVFYASLSKRIEILGYDRYAVEEIQAGQISSWENTSQIMDGFIRNEKRTVCRYVRANLRV